MLKVKKPENREYANHDKQPYARTNEENTDPQHPETSVTDANYRGDAVDELSNIEEGNHDFAKKELEQQNGNNTMY